MGLNLSAGFGAIGEGFAKMGAQHAQADIEAMKDARAENLARMQYKWRAEHDDNIQDRQFKHDERMNAAAADRQEASNIAADKRNRDSNIAYLDRTNAAQAAMTDRAIRDNENQARRNDKTLIAQNRLKLAEAVGESDRIIAQLNREIRLEADKNYELQAITDPNEKSAAMARDAVIGPMLQQLVEARNAKRKMITAFTLNGVQLGDTGFQGIQTEALRPAGSSNASPIMGPQTPNGLTDELPGGGGLIPTTPPTGSVPGASATGMPPTVGPVRAPITRMQGPLKLQNQLIPLNPNAAPSLMDDPASMGR